MSAREPFTVAVDWGTSSLRVWVLSRDGAVLAERRSPDGMGTLTPDRFEGVLRGHLDALDFLVSHLARPTPVVICGMAGARQGWREAPYADAPGRLDGIIGKAVSVPADGLDVRILPGMAQHHPDKPDVMRGEETQLLGLLLDDPTATGLVAMPGTHSKWVALDEGTVTSFSTVMTGELFALLARQSILRHTIGEAAPSGDPAAEAFLAGARLGLAEPDGLVSRLFGIRAGGLLFGTAGDAAADRLSGLLIGAEVGSALAHHEGGTPVILVASGRMADLYAAVLGAAGATVRHVDADDAVRKGLFHAARRLWPG